MIGLAIDSTERLVTERALRISEQNYRTLIEEAPSALFRATAGGALLQVNRAMIEMLGYDSATQSELLMRDLPQIFTPGGFAEFRRAIEARPVLQAFESVWLRRDGTLIPVSLSCRVLRNGAGAPFYLDALAIDITEKKHLEAQLGHAQRMQAAGQLAGGVAHDFNNLLTVIAGHVEMLLLENPGEDLQHRLIPVREAAERASILTRQLLAFSRKQVMQSRVVDVNSLIAKFSRLIARVIRESIAFSFVPGDDAGYVRADPHQLEQVIMNLAVNAQDAMPAGGRLTIGTSRATVADSLLDPAAPPAGDYVRITVRDTGHGIDEQTATRIFEPFFTTKEAGAGTGLGLSMAYGIVTQSGGRISVNSAPGAGATFTVYLPRVTEPAHAPAEEAMRPTVHPPGRETILVAEDEAGVRLLVEAYLRSLGYYVLCAADGDEALHIARTHSGDIHLLLTDLVMPHRGGRELAADLRNLYPNVKAIFMSGYSEERDVMDESGNRFLAKPLSMDLLARTVRESLEDRLAAGG